MKTKFTMILMAVVLFFTTATAQEVKNMEFMGIPITGNVNDFSDKLESKGFSPLQEEAENITLSGKFTNRDVVVALIPIKGTNEIYRVGVIYEPNTSWDLLETHQNYLIEAFTKKYGEVSSSIREIDSSYKDNGNYIFIGFHNGKVKYSDTWNLDNGTILIFTTSISSDSASTMIIYEDSKSAQALEENIMNDI